MEQENQEFKISYGVDKDMSSESVSVAQECYTIYVTGGIPSLGLEQSQGVDKTEEKIPQDPIGKVNYLKNKGLINTPEYKQAVIELEKMLGVDEMNPFGTNELDIFEDRLKEMTVADMQKLANKIGANPFLERPHLKNVLIKEFLAGNKNNRRNIMPSPAKIVQIDPKHPDYAKIQKILGEF